MVLKTGLLWNALTSYPAYISWNRRKLLVYNPIEGGAERRTQKVLRSRCIIEAFKKKGKRTVWPLTVASLRTSVLLVEVLFLEEILNPRCASEYWNAFRAVIHFAQTHCVKLAYQPKGFAKWMLAKVITKAVAFKTNTPIVFTGTLSCCTSWI